MVIRLVNTTLLVVITVGLVFAYRADRAYREVLAQYERLEATVGSFEVRDRSRLCVQAVETGEERHFAWRLYLPAGMRFRWNCQGNASAFPMSLSNGCELIVRVRVDENEKGCLTLHTMGVEGHQRLPLGDSKLAELLRRHWSRVDVERLGTDGAAAIDTDEAATLLRLTLPDGMKREAEDTLERDLLERIEEALVLIEIGSAEAFLRAEASE